jgi:alanine transaminase
VKGPEDGLCPNLSGQIVMGMVMSPPQEGEDSHALFVAERDEILAGVN